ncbi:MAG: hypothetical protein J6T10_18985 [Methanobrevibacter sp.]|nr:hypothetical protein [Methanobrevibacter sp.]
MMRNYYAHNKNKSFISTWASRINQSMSKLKSEEYYNLLWYTRTGEYPRYGHICVIYRFYKNLKYRRKFIKTYIKNRGV